MVSLLRPVPRTGSRAAAETRPLAGSRTVWFSECEVLARDADPQWRRVSDLSSEDIRRLSAPRPPLCGVSLDMPRIMGILNLTPDSFSDGGDFPSVEAAVRRAGAMAQEADFLDIGGESTRPGAEEVPAADEIARVVPVIEAIRAAGIATPISIDTRKAAVAEAALTAGADMVNDVSALRFDPEMAHVVAEAGVPVCLMHARGDPAVMQADPRYENVVPEVHDHLAERISAAKAAGIAPENIVVDPGIGFDKTLQHNVRLLRGLSLYHAFGLPVLLGASRKRFIGTIGGAEVARDRMAGSVAVALHAAAQGAQILRVHDTYETRQALRLHLALNEDE